MTVPRWVCTPATSSLCDTDNSKEMYDILKAGKSENVNKPKLMNCKTRGGIWGITNACLNIFKMAEMVFVDKVNVPNIRKFDLDGMLEEVCWNENVLSNLELVMEDALVNVKEQEIANNVLHSMVKL